MKKYVGLAVAVGLVVAGMLSATAQAEGTHLRICHATGSESNPYVSISPSIAGVYNGHLGQGHQNGEDIIPPFVYKDETYSQNWPEGEDTWNNNCGEPELDTYRVVAGMPRYRGESFTAAPGLVCESVNYAGPVGTWSTTCDGHTDSGDYHDALPPKFPSQTFVRLHDLTTGTMTVLIGG